MLFSNSAPKSGRSMASVATRVGGLLALASAVACLTGCPNIERDLEDFEQRQAANPPPVVKVECGTAASAIEGQFVFALATELGPTKPLMFLTDITTEDDGMSFTFQPLASADRKTPVGDPVTVSGYPIEADGTFLADLPLLKVPGAGNPITGTDIEADIALDGAACEDALCGKVTGKVVKPIDYTLDPKKRRSTMGAAEGSRSRATVPRL